MRRFNSLFGRVMIGVTLTEIGMLGTDVPVITVNGENWVEFTTWANKSCSPNIEFGSSWFTEDAVHIRIKGPWTPKSHSTIKAHFGDYEIYADDIYEDDGRPIGSSSLYLKIPYVQSI